MSGYITFWSKEYIKNLEKAQDKGPLRVIFGGEHQSMPSIASVKKGDIIFPVCIREKTLCVMGRLPVERIESAFDYLIRETGERHGALIPSGIVLKSEGPLGEFYAFEGGSGYKGKITLPDNFTEVLEEDKFISKPHCFHEEPVTCCAGLAASGENGSDISPRYIPPELISRLRFGKTKAAEKPLKLDKNGCLSPISLSGFVRKMSDDTFEIFESLF